MNRQIRAREVLLIDENGQSIGLVPVERALQISEARGFDLVEVAPNAHPPVTRLLDFGKFQYEQSKQERKSKAKQKEIEVKEIRLGYKTSEHDRNVRLDKAADFLKKGDKVKVVLRLMGREQMFTREAIDDVLNFQKDIPFENVIEQQPKKLGNRVIMVVAPAKKTSKE